MASDAEFERVRHDLERASKLAENMMDERNKISAELLQLRVEHKMLQMSYNALCGKVHRIAESAKQI